MTFAIERKMKTKNRQAAGDLVDHWNHVRIASFFLFACAHGPSCVVLFWTEADGGGALSGV
jgi:hypothetical protein